MVHLLRVFVIGAMAGLIAGCESYSENSASQTTDLYSIDSCLDFPETCETIPSQNYLRVQINQTAPIYAIMTSGHTTFDVSGYCNPAGYKTAKVRWKVLDSAGTFKYQYGADNPCDGGRFQLSVPLPSDGDRDTRTYTLVVWLVGISKTPCANQNAIDNGNKYACTNPSTSQQSIEFQSWQF